MCGAVPHQFSAYTFPLSRTKTDTVLCGRKLPDQNNDGQSSEEFVFSKCILKVEQIILCF